MLNADITAGLPHPDSLSLNSSCSYTYIYSTARDSILEFQCVCLKILNPYPAAVQ